MTIASTRVHVRALCDDARLIHVQARERLAHGDVRDVAEKVWFVTKRATEELLALARHPNFYETLVGHYFTRTSYLHATCFFN